MNVGDLKELLESLPNDVEVCAQIQPHYPIVVNIEGVWNPLSEEGFEDEVEECMDYNEVDRNTATDMVLADREHLPQRVYIVTGSSPYESPYGSSKAWALMETR